MGIRLDLLGIAALTPNTKAKLKKEERLLVPPSELIDSDVYDLIARRDLYNLIAISIERLLRLPNDTPQNDPAVDWIALTKQLVHWLSLEPDRFGKEIELLSGYVFQAEERYRLEQPDSDERFRSSRYGVTGVHDNLIILKKIVLCDQRIIERKVDLQLDQYDVL